MVGHGSTGFGNFLILQVCLLIQIITHFSIMVFKDLQMMVEISLSTQEELYSTVDLDGIQIVTHKCGMLRLMALL